MYPRKTSLLLLKPFSHINLKTATNMHFFKLLVPVMILNVSCASEQDPVRLEQSETETTIFAGERPVLSYVHAETMPPEGIDPLYKRSAYIHPLWSPGGEVLTRIQPPDHYHHYGIWNPWTHTHFDTLKVDFWNLALGQGTVRFAEYQETHEEKDVAGFSARQDHIYFLNDGSENVAINEIWKITARAPADSLYVVDLTSTLTTPLQGGITLEAYRYGGGLGFRATEKWGTHNSTVLTSEGKVRADADGTGARWVIVEGESSVPRGRSGILFLSHPSNRAHPEPMRMWPPEQYEGKANVFFEFCPIRHQEWVLEPGQEYTLRYRMVVFDGSMPREAADEFWETYAAQPPEK